MKARTCFTISVIFSVVFIAVGLTILLAVPDIIHNMTEQNIILSNKGIGYGYWKNIPFPIQIEIWVWHVTNAEDVWKKGEKPNIVQKGPYVYQEKRDKTNIKFHNNGTVSYIAPYHYYFDEEKSIGDPMVDTFTTINVPYLTAINTAKWWGFFEKIGLDVIAKNTKSLPYENYTVHDFIWGYTDPLLVELKKIKPDAVPQTIFGLFYGKNNSNDGVYNVNTGENDSSQTNNIEDWRGSPTVNFWSTEYANMINGTDATYNHPFIDSTKNGYVFSSDLCRSIKSVYEKTIKIENIPAYRFVGPPDDFSNATVNPENGGFCTPNLDHCLPGGLLNVSNCQKNAPVVMSLPHFLYTEQKVLDMVTGDLNPEKEEHQTFFDIEPNTGAPLRINKRLQINIHQLPYPSFTNWKNVKEAYLPVAWVNESCVITDEQGPEFRWLTIYPPIITTWSQWFFIVLGIVLLTVGCVVYFVKFKKEDPSDSINESPSERTPLLQ